jgi:hypothetical protein
MVVIAEPPESLIVMETQVDPATPARVIWLDAVEAPKLGNVSGLRKPTLWPSYADFFSFLLDSQEEEALVIRTFSPR